MNNIIFWHDQFSKKVLFEEFVDGWANKALNIDEGFKMADNA